MSFIGRKIEVGLGREGTRGTATTPSFWLANMNASVDDKFEGVLDENTIGVIEDANDFKVTKKWSAGEIGGKVADRSIGQILKSCFGTCTSAVKETTAYNHTMSVLETNLHPTLSVVMKNPNQEIKFVNSVVDKLTIKAELGKFVEFTANIIGKLGAVATDVPAYTAENNFIAKDVTFKTATNQAGLDAASPIIVKSVEITFDNNAETYDVLGNVEPSDVFNKQFSVSGKIELLYEDATYKALALAGTVKAMRIGISDTTVTIGGSSNPTLNIDLYTAKLTEWAKTDADNELIKQTLTFKGLYSLADTKMVTAILTNTTVGYN